MQAYIDAINGHKLQRGHANHAWLCLDLLEIFCQLAERGHASSVRPILDYPLKHCPEILLLGMAHINVQFTGFCSFYLFFWEKVQWFFIISLFMCLFLVLSLYFLLQTPYNLLQHEVSSIVFPVILKSAVASGMILHLWHVNPNLVLRGIIDSQNNDVDSITRILDICQELKVGLLYGMDVSYWLFF